MEKWFELVSVGSKTVLLDRHCPDAHPAPKNGKDARWRNKCRNIVLTHARTDRVIGLAGAFVAGEFDGNGLRSESDLLLLNGSTFAEGVNLANAKIGGQVTLIGATVGGKLNANKAISLAIRA